MIPIIKPLPHWVLTDLQPAFYDSEAGSVLSLLSKIYGKIEEVVTTVNLQSDKIAEAVEYMQTNLEETVTKLYEDSLEEGTITSEFTITYDSETETLNIVDTLVSNVL